MPKDPKTGKDLPYEGEPGFEEAMAENPEAYMADSEGRLAAVEELIGAADADPLMEDPQDGSMEEDASEVFQPDPEVVNQVFMLMFNRPPSPEKDSDEIQLIESVLTVEMQEDLMRQEIDLNDIVFEVHRAREIDNVDDTPMEAAPEEMPAAPFFEA